MLNISKCRHRNPKISRWLPEHEAVNSDFFLLLAICVSWILKKTTELGSDVSSLVTGINKCQRALRERGEDLGSQRVAGLPGQPRVQRSRGRRPGTCVRFPVEAFRCRVHRHACRCSDSRVTQFLCWRFPFLFYYIIFFVQQIPLKKFLQKLNSFTSVEI